MSRDRRIGETGGEALLRQGSVHGAAGSSLAGAAADGPHRTVGFGPREGEASLRSRWQHRRVGTSVPPWLRFGAVRRHGKAGASSEGTAGKGLAAHGLRSGRGEARAGRGRRIGETTRAPESTVLRHGRGRGASRSVVRGIEPRGDRRTEGFGPTGAGSRVVEVLGPAGSRVSSPGCFGTRGAGQEARPTVRDVRDRPEAPTDLVSEGADGEPRGSREQAV